MKRLHDTVGSTHDYVRFDIEGDAERIAARLTEILPLLDQHWESGFPDRAFWSERLPLWLRSQFRRQVTQEEIEAFTLSVLRLPAGSAERRETAKDAPWTLDNWLLHFEPSEREWSGWRLDIIDERHLVLDVGAEEGLFPKDALLFALFAAGADTVNWI